MPITKEVEEHFTEIGQLALLAVLEGKLTLDQATEGLQKRRQDLVSCGLLTHDVSGS